MPYLQNKGGTSHRITSMEAEEESDEVTSHDNSTHQTRTELPPPDKEHLKGTQLTSQTTVDTWTLLKK